MSKLGRLWRWLGVLILGLVGLGFFAVYAVIGITFLAGSLLFSDGTHSNWSGEYLLQSSPNSSIVNISVLPGISAGAVRNREGHNAKVVLRAPIEKWVQLAAENNCGEVARPLQEAHAAPKQRIVLTLQPANSNSLDRQFSFWSWSSSVENSLQNFGSDDYTYGRRYMVRLGLSEEGGVTSFAQCPYRNSQRSLCRIYFQPDSNFSANVLSYAYLHDEWNDFTGTIGCLVNKMADVKQESRSTFGGTYFDATMPISIQGPNERHSYGGRWRDTYCLDHLPDAQFGEMDSLVDAVWPRRCDLSVTLLGGQETREYPPRNHVHHIAHSIAWRHGLRTTSYDENGAYRERYSLNWYLGELNGFPIRIRCQAEDAGIIPWCTFGWPEVSSGVQLSYQFPRAWLSKWREIHQFVLANLEADLVPRITNRTVEQPNMAPSELH